MTSVLSSCEAFGGDVEQSIGNVEKSIGNVGIKVMGKIQAADIDLGIINNMAWSSEARQ